MLAQPLTAQEAQEFQSLFGHLVNVVSEAVLDKQAVISLAFTSMFAGGHLLLEDAPGTGKTALARAMAAAVDASHSRIQFTPDMLPSDITGINMYDQSTGKWDFHRGPIFAQVVLADEINRASPKTQSALLEVMEEGQVTVDGTSYPVDKPFMVIATQNPVEQTGTYPLPEAQLDRFLIRTSIGYPSRQAMIEILNGSAAPDRSTRVRTVIDSSGLQHWASRVSQNHAEPAVLDYVAALAEATRNNESVRLGVSTRACIGLVRCARVFAAASQGRNYVLPEDIKALAPSVWSHRIILDPDAEFAGVSAEDVISQALNTVPVPLKGR